MANRQIEVHVVKVKYVKATSPEDAAMARAGISLLLRMINKARVTSDKQEDCRRETAQSSSSIDEQIEERAVQ